MTSDALLVLDTSLLVAAVNRRDVHHAQAQPVLRGIVDGSIGKALLPECVLLELATVLGARAGVDVAMRTIRTLLDAQEVEFVRTGRFLPQGLARFGRQEALHLSLTDAILLALLGDDPQARLATFDAALRDAAGDRAIPR